METNIVCQDPKKRREIEEIPIALQIENLVYDALAVHLRWQQRSREEWLALQPNSQHLHLQATQVYMCCQHTALTGQFAYICVGLGLLRGVKMMYVLILVQPHNAAFIL